MPYGTGVIRYCALDDHKDVVWAESEVLGDQAVVKVTGSPAALAAVEADPDITRFPVDDLDAVIPQNRLGRMRGLLTSAGYTPAEAGRIQRGATLRDLLEAFTVRRRKPRPNPQGGRPVMDGEARPCRPVADVDRAVK